MQPPPSSTLFPYTTLFRSRSRSSCASSFASFLGEGSSSSAHATEANTRSEEHTSELQSLAYLVCRLLLEKKKQALLDCDLLDYLRGHDALVADTHHCE